MTDAEAIQMLRVYHEGLFPKVCNNCGHVYATLRDYILTTDRLGSATSYDAEMGRFNVGPAQQLGGMVMGNCACGSTLALSTKHMPNAQMRRLLDWLVMEMKRRNQGQQELME
jgi:hypothetical protein